MTADPKVRACYEKRSAPLKYPVGFGPPDVGIADDSSSAATYDSARRAGALWEASKVPPGIAQQLPEWVFSRSSGEGGASTSGTKGGGGEGAYLIDMAIPRETLGMGLHAEVLGIELAEDQDGLRAQAEHAAATGGEMDFGAGTEGRGGNAATVGTADEGSSAPPKEATRQQKAPRVGKNLIAVLHSHSHSDDIVHQSPGPSGPASTQPEWPSALPLSPSGPPPPLLESPGPSCPGNSGRAPRSRGRNWWRSTWIFAPPTPPPWNLSEKITKAN